MNTQKILNQAIQAIDQCVAIGVVDLMNGKLIAINTTSSHPTRVLDMVSAATMDLFAGKNILEIEKTFKQRRKSKTSRHYFQEIIVNSDNLIHFFLRDQANQNQVGVFVCSNKVVMGMALNQVRHIMPAITDSLSTEVV